MAVIHQIFNSSVVSGPETLVLPNLKPGACDFPHKVVVVLLQETRLRKGAGTVAQYARELGYEVVEIEVAGRFDWQAVKSLRALWRKDAPAIAHAHGPKATLFALLAARALPKPRRPALVTTHHGVRAYDRSRKLKLFESIYEKTVIPFTDLCLTVCSSDRELLIRRGLAPKRLAVHVNGTSRPKLVGLERETARTRARAEFARAIPGLPGEDFLIGMVARLSPEKNHRKALEALALTRAPHARLLCFGSGELEDELKAAAVELGLGSRVHWLGYRRDVDSLLVGLDLLLSLSDAEGLPINLIEAGWSAVPVVAHGVDGVKDVILQGESGVRLAHDCSAFDVASEIDALAGDAARAAALGQGLQARVEREFSAPAWTATLAEQYARLMR